MNPPELHAVLCPVSSTEAVLIYSSHHESSFAQLGSTILSAVVPGFHGGQGLPAGTNARLFQTTALGEELWDSAQFFTTQDDPSFRLPVALGQDGKYVKQIPLKELDVSLQSLQVDPVHLMLMVSTQIMVRRLEAIERAIRQLDIKVSEVLSRQETTQKAKLRDILDDLGDIERLDDVAQFDWDLIQHHGETLRNLHYEFVQEIGRIRGAMGQGPNATRAWAALTAEQSGRLSELLDLLVLTLQALERWTLVSFRYQPVDGSSQNRVLAAVERLDKLRSEARKAIDLIPISHAPKHWRWNTVLSRGMVLGERELGRARRNYELVEPKVARCKPVLAPLKQRSLAVLEVRPAHDAEPVPALVHTS